jgi:transposase-like protein
MSECENRVSAENPLFAKRWFSDDVIVTGVRWYLRFRLSYRDVA